MTKWRLAGTRTAPALFESLEARRLMWAAVEDGVLVVTPSIPSDWADDLHYVYGKKTNFSASVSPDDAHPGQALVSLGWYIAGDTGVETIVSVPLNGVHGIRIQGGDGRDILAVDAKSAVLGSLGLPATLLGGNGDDILFGGAENDVLIGGAGRDRGRAGGGADALDVEAGLDYDPGSIVQEPYDPNGPMRAGRYFSEFLLGNVPLEARFGDDPLEADRNDLANGSASWRGAMARALGKPAAEPDAAELVIAAPSAPEMLNLSAAISVFAANSTREIWDDWP